MAAHTMHETRILRTNPREPEGEMNSPWVTGGVPPSIKRPSRSELDSCAGSKPQAEHLDGAISPRTRPTPAWRGAREEKMRPQPGNTFSVTECVSGYR